MLTEHEQAPHFEYIEDLNYGHWFSVNYPIEDEWSQCYGSLDYITCSECKKPHHLSECIRVLHKDSTNVSSYVCTDCINAHDDIDFCLYCGEMFYASYKGDKFCAKCKQALLPGGN